MVHKPTTDPIKFISKNFDMQGKTLHSCIGEMVPPRTKSGALFFGLPTHSLAPPITAFFWSSLVACSLASRAWRFPLVPRIVRFWEKRCPHRWDVCDLLRSLPTYRGRILRRRCQDGHPSQVSGRFGIRFVPLRHRETLTHS